MAKNDDNSLEFQKIDSKELFSDFDKGKIQNALKNIIYPTFKPYANTIYKVQIINIRKVKKDKGFFYVCDIAKDGMTFTMNINNSFRFQLKVLLERHNLTLEQIYHKDILISKDNNGYFSIQMN